MRTFLMALCFLLSLVHDGTAAEGIKAGDLPATTIEESDYVMVVKTNGSVMRALKSQLGGSGGGGSAQVGTLVNTNTVVTNALVAVDATKTNVIPATSAMVTNALGFAPQPSASTLTSLSTNTTIGTGTVVLSSVTDGKQPASANLTNWSAIAATSAGIQSTLGQVYQATNSNLTLLSGYGPGTWQATNANLTLLSGYGPATWQATNSTLTTLAGTTTVGTGQIVLSSVTDNKQPLAATLTALSTNTVTGSGRIALESLVSTNITDNGWTAQINNALVKTNLTVNGTLVTDSLSVTGATASAVAYWDSNTNLATATSANIQAALGQVYQATNSTLTALSTNTVTGTGRIVLESAAGGGAPSGTVVNSVAVSGLLSVDSTKTNGIAATAAHITNAWGIFDGSTTKFVAGDGTLRTPAGGSGSTNITDSGTEAIAQGVLTSAGGFRQYEGAALTHAGTVTLDFNAANPKTSITLTGDVTFAFSNVDTNKTYIIRVFNNQATNCAITFPTGSSTNFLGGAPTYVTTKKYARWVMSCVGTGDTNVLSAWAEN